MNYQNFQEFATAIGGNDYAEILNRCDSLMQVRPQLSYRDDVKFLSAFLQFPKPIVRGSVTDECYEGTRVVVEALVRKNKMSPEALLCFQ